MSNTFTIPSIEDINTVLNPVLNLLNEIKAKVDNQPKVKEYYRNKDLKAKFGFSDNTITTYRDNNTLPFTKFGEIFYYPVKEINSILEQNSNYDYFKSNLKYKGNK